MINTLDTLFDTMDIKGKRVLVRSDLNVPLANGAITDTSRIDRSIKTYRELLSRGASVILLTHLGRPQGIDPTLSLTPIAEYLRTKLAPYAVELCALDDVPQATAPFVVVENIRFFAEEEQNDPAFAARLATLGDIYVSDGFSVAHRAHASTEGVARLLPAYAGRLMEEELNALSKALHEPERPLMALVGGSKVSTKLSVLENLLDKVDHLVIGGAMANTFLAAQSHSIGTSLYEPDLIPTAQEILHKATQGRCNIILPLDVVVTPRIEEGVPHTLVHIKDVAAEQMIVDIGDLSISHILETMGECKTLLWNGPLGVFEVPPFDRGTNQVARGAAKLTRLGYLTSIAGGGDTVSALAHAGALDAMTYVSTAGGAFLEYIEGKALPGVAVLES